MSFEAHTTHVNNNALIGSPSQVIELYDIFLKGTSGQVSGYLFEATSMGETGTNAVNERFMLSDTTGSAIGYSATALASFCDGLKFYKGCWFLSGTNFSYAVITYGAEVK